MTLVSEYKIILLPRQKKGCFRDETAFFSLTHPCKESNVPAIFVINRWQDANYTYADAIIGKKKNRGR